MLKSLLKYVRKGFEIVLRHYVIFKTLNFMHMNSPGSFHTTSDVMSDLQANFVLDLSRMGQIWFSAHVEKDALSSKLKYQCDTFYDLFFFFITSIQTYSM